jgi:excisionase family DNA binding protein
MSKNDNNQTKIPTDSEQAAAPAKMPVGRLVRAEVIAEALDVHKRTVCLWAQSGIIPCIRIGGVVRFDLEDVLRATR